ncbi:hypothetical protein SAMN05216221_2250 [Pseudomonas oryzae]|uniref:Uncharacterized protein n=1 Tax=Pseudomonas oryzae TaxID=1392877 RepID=A0A1H1TSJ3_9PSED|nr:hypothetical protein SAMN05216221_2250 [Pseudomonas oryzae]
MRAAGLDKRARAPYKDRLARSPLREGHALRSDRKAGGLVKKKKPVDPVRQANKNRGYRIGWLIALAGIVCGFVLVVLKQG